MMVLSNFFLFLSRALLAYRQASCLFFLGAALFAAKS